MAGRPLGSLSSTGKQNEEERKAKKRSYPKTPEAAQRSLVAKKLKRLENKQIKANEALKIARDELSSIGLGHIPVDGNETELMKLLRSPTEKKLEFLTTTTGIIFEEHSTQDYINRMIQHAYSMKMTHKAEGRRPFTLPICF